MLLHPGLFQWRFSFARSGSVSRNERARARRTVLTALAVVAVAFVAFAAALDVLPQGRYPEHAHRLAAVEQLRAARFSRYFADTHLRPWFAAVLPRH